MTPHTPGPWVAECDHHRTHRRKRMALITTTEGSQSIDCTGSGATYPADCANARLISAAPDLYAALRVLLAMSDCSCDGECLPDCHRSAAKAAIAKAEGR